MLFCIRIPPLELQLSHHFTRSLRTLLKKALFMRYLSLQLAITVNHSALLIMSSRLIFNTVPVCLEETLLNPFQCTDSILKNCRRLRQGILI